MNTKKQQCIKDAYLKLISEEEFNKLEPDSDGWLFSSELLLLSVSGTILDFKEGKQLMARPKYLQGIETNNNWISIESESDLPKDDGWYWVIDSDGDVIQVEYFTFYKSFTDEGVTHYQNLVEPSKPLF